MGDDLKRLTDSPSEGVTVVTTMHPEGDRWIASVYGGPFDGYSSVMDLSGDPAVLHDSVLELIKAPVT